MRLTVQEIEFLLAMIGKQFGFGYAKEVAVGRLQAKLSVLLEMADKNGWVSETIPQEPTNDDDDT